MAIRPGTAVVFDINVYLDYILGDDGGWPSVPTPPPPTTGNASADAIALAFADRFRLFASPHILRNVHEKMLAAGNGRRVADEFVRLIVDMCEFSGGAVVDPTVTDAGIGDFEDSHIIALARDAAVNADVIVSRDADLLRLGPAWHGRLILPPRDFVHQAM
ncbi:putative toxin-antitoxin system toxin component, PIN family [Leucobacter albus]|uniref:Toxin-antitoxin system toxin component, PIN family n=1 Tax=Leucobacter albus TaxID=272210 RepID=A0ABW3TNJ3_9MICO